MGKDFTQSSNLSADFPASDFDTSAAQPSPAFCPLPSAGNQALQSGIPDPLKLQTATPAAGNLSQSACYANEPEKPAEQPVIVHWNKYTPWFFTVDGSPSASAISMELYGTDVTSFQPVYPVMAPSDQDYRVLVETYIADPELLRPVYRDRFHEAMWAQFREDIAELEDIIFTNAPFPEPSEKGMVLLRRWAARGNLRTTSGRTYFDAFLARLRSDYWYRDYLVTTGAHHTYFDSLFDWSRDRAGEVSALIAMNSREFGAYRPAWASVETAIQPQPPGAPKRPPDAVPVNPELVKRSADLILEKLSGPTFAADSHVIADAIEGLPGPEQSAVLKDMMSRYESGTGSDSAATAKPGKAECSIGYSRTSRATTRIESRNRSSIMASLRQAQPRFETWPRMGWQVSAVDHQEGPGGYGVLGGKGQQGFQTRMGPGPLFVLMAARNRGRHRPDARRRKGFSRRFQNEPAVGQGIGRRRHGNHSLPDHDRDPATHMEQECLQGRAAGRRRKAMR